MTPVEFLTARLDEDEAVARAAEGHSSFDGTGIVTGPRGTAVIISTAATHIARHDPARVLREVEAKRALLAHLVDASRGYNFMHATDAEIAADRERGIVAKHLAAVYADHPDYRADWA